MNNFARHRLHLEVKAVFPLTNAPGFLPHQNPLGTW